jgi:hypothetical protein
VENGHGANVVHFRNAHIKVLSGQHVQQLDVLDQICMEALQLKIRFSFCEHCIV